MQKKYYYEDLELTHQKSRERSKREYYLDIDNSRAKVRENSRRNKKVQPKWITKEQKEELKLIYKNCPKGYHVDHIIPIKGKNITGLHVPWNLQYLPAIENMKKGNRI